MSFCIDTPSYRVDISTHYQSLTKTLHFISILVAKFLHWLAKPDTTLLLYQGLGPAMLKHHRHPNIGGVPSLKPSLDTTYFLWNSGKILWFCKIHWFSKGKRCLDDIVLQFLKTWVLLKRQSFQSSRTTSQNPFFFPNHDFVLPKFFKTTE